MGEKYYTNKLQLNWDLTDSEEYQELTGELLPEFIILDEKEEGYTYDELEHIVREEEDYSGYEVEWWIEE
tara:strand:- start:159 stop:368 length:210 start_codon:yes stop_codon:yes gene_type:complete